MLFFPQSFLIKKVENYCFTPLEQFEQSPGIFPFLDSQDLNLFVFLVQFFFVSLCITGGRILLKVKIQKIIWNIVKYFSSASYIQNKKINIPGQYFSAFSTFTALLLANLTGTIPTSTCTTAQLAPIFVCSLYTFMLYNFFGVLIHKFKIFNLFFPTGSPFNLALLIVPIEFVSYIFRVISISVRLFANMMAGHTLVKVIAGFGFEMFSLTGLEIYLVSSIIVVLILLSFLEFAVAMIQSYVFITLLNMYYVDAIFLH
jgi:ATP synthase subunit 6